MKKKLKHSKDYDNFSKKEAFRRSRRGQVLTHESVESIFEITESEAGEKLKLSYFLARVVEVHKGYSFVSPEPKTGLIKTQDVWLAQVARKYLQTERLERNLLVVGDRVLCLKAEEKSSSKSQELPACVVEFRLQRKNVIERLDPMHKERTHVLVSNIDTLVVVASFIYPKVKWGLIDRYLVLAELEKIPVVILLNKKDLLSTQKEKFKNHCHERKELYSKLGYPIYEIGALNLDHEDQKILKNIFAKKICIISGHSGVGKSSIANHLEPELVQDVESEEILRKGRHTTTYASFLKHKKAGYVIDTPGIRSFVLSQKSAVELTWAFVEMRAYMNKCQFRECAHLTEPGCAVLQAVKEGHISEWRYQSFQAILSGESGREGKSF